MKYITRDPNSKEILHKVDAVQWHEGDQVPYVQNRRPNLIEPCFYFGFCNVLEPHMHLTKYCPQGGTATVVHDGDWIVARPGFGLGGNKWVWPNADFRRVYFKA